MSQTIFNLMTEIDNMRNPTPTSVFGKFFRETLEGADRNLNDFRNNIRCYFEYSERSVVDNDTLRASKRPVHTPKGIDWEARTAQQRVSQANAYGRMANGAFNKAQEAKQEVLNCIKKYNINKRVNFTIKNTIKNPPKPNCSKVKVGGALGFLWTFKEVLADIIKLYCVMVGSMSFEEWLINFKKDIYKAFDDIIIGLIASFLAEAAVAGLIAAGVISGPVVVIAIIVILFAAIIGCLISWLLDVLDVSFSRYVFEKIPNMVYTPSF